MFVLPKHELFIANDSCYIFIEFTFTLALTFFLCSPSTHKQTQHTHKHTHTHIRTRTDCLLEPTGCTKLKFFLTLIEGASPTQRHGPFLLIARDYDHGPTRVRQATHSSMLRQSTSCCLPTSEQKQRTKKTKTK